MKVEIPQVVQAVSLETMANPREQNDSLETIPTPAATAVVGAVAAETAEAEETMEISPFSLSPLEGAPLKVRMKDSAELKKLRK